MVVHGNVLPTVPCASTSTAAIPDNIYSVPMSGAGLASGCDPFPRSADKSTRQDVQSVCAETEAASRGTNGLDNHRLPTPV